MPWKVENYYIVGKKILNIEITTPLVEFLYVKIDDVKRAWLEMLSQLSEEIPEFDMSWSMQPHDNDVLVTIRVAKAGELADLTTTEVRQALDATDALFGGAADHAPAPSKKTSTMKRWTCTGRKQ